MILLIFFTSVGSISKLGVFIVSHRSGLLLYYLSPLYNLIFIIGQRFSIGFRSGLNDGHLIIFFPINLSCSKNSHTGKLRYLRRSIVVYKYTLPFETARLGLVSCKESLVQKITIVRMVQFNCFINDPIMVWSTIPIYIISLPLPCCLLLVTGMSEFNRIHLLAHSPSPSNVTQNWSVKIT